MEVEVQFCELDRFRVEGTPSLSSKDPSGDGLEVAFVRVFEDEG
jgi:hypothetical protein